MKEKTIEVKNEGELIGYVHQFRGPAFTNYATGYTPLDLSKKAIAGPQPSLEQAIEIVKNER